MRALRWYAARDVRIDALPDPDPSPGEAVVQVEWCGLCGTDVHEYTHGPVLIPSRPHPLTGKVPPVTLGHEFAGTIAAVNGDPRFAPGERVTANACLVCHECAWCRAGQFNLCARLGSIGLSWDGALAEFVRVPTYCLHRVPAAVAPEAAALTEPAAVAVHACRRAGVHDGESVVVVGAGTIGLLVLQAARAQGASGVFVIEPLAARRAVAVQLGARAAFEPGDGVDKRIADATGGRRGDVVFECTGLSAGIDTALRVSGKGARVVLVGIYREATRAPWGRLQAHEKQLIGSSAYTDEFPAALALLASGAVTTAPLVTDRIGLDDVERRGLAALLENPAQHLKILVHP